VKKLVILTLMVSVVIVFAPAVSALEYKTGSITHEYGADLRTRFISQQGFTGEKDVKSFDRAQENQDLAELMNMFYGLNMQAGDDDPIGDLSYWDLRARLYYHAIFDENLLKFVTEVDIYSAAERSGEKDIGITDRNSSKFDSGTDDNDVDLINLYASYNSNFKHGIFNFNLGWMDSVLARGLISNQEGAFQADAWLQVMDSLFLGLNYQRDDGLGVGRYRNDAATDNYRAKPPAKLGRMAKAMLSI